MQRRGFEMTILVMWACFACATLWHTVALAAAGQAHNGHKFFQAYCMVCHGAQGKGDGIAAAHLEVKPRDLTNATFMAVLTDQQVFETIRNPASGHHRPLAMPIWKDVLPDPYIWDLVAYVRTLHRQPPFHGLPARGAALFTDYCWTCHGATGKGDGVLTPLTVPRPLDLTDPAMLARRTDIELYDIISQGGAAVGRSVAMPSWGHLLTPQEIWDLVAYLHHLARRP